MVVHGGRSASSKANERRKEKWHGKKHSNACTQDTMYGAFGKHGRTGDQDDDDMNGAARAAPVASTGHGIWYCPLCFTVHTSSYE